MAKFASAEKQAASVMKVLQGSELKSVRTVSNFEERLTQISRYMQEYRLGSLRELTVSQALNYLTIRGQEVGQKTLDMERQAIQHMFWSVTHILDKGETLERIKSELDESLKSRAYTPEQVAIVAGAQNERNQLATEIAYAAGLRAHELLTLMRPDERAADERPAAETKWLGRGGEIYTVTGKGGLTREVLIPHHLAARLEAARLGHPIERVDRDVRYTQHYSIGGGNAWSSSFTQASNRDLGWSRGAHGLRHAYAQERMNELQRLGYVREVALRTVSQELGHFRPEITETYLR